MNKQQPKQNWLETAIFVLIAIIWAIVVTVGCQFLIAYPMSWLLGGNLAKPFWVFVYYIIYYGITLALLILVPPRLIKAIAQKKQKQPQKLAKELSETTPTELGVQHLPTFVDIGLAPIGYIVYAVLANFITNFMSSTFPWFNSDEAQDVGFGYFLTTGDRIFAMLAIVIVAPIAEELIMRGWLYGKVRQKLNAPLAIVLISLVFACLHGQWNVGVSVFILSVILCTLREITGTVWSGALLHILSNGIAFYLLYIALV